jgi:hypothetical protein
MKINKNKADVKEDLQENLCQKPLAIKVKNQLVEKDLDDGHVLIVT